MYEKFRSAAFGRCPNVFCQGQPVLPVGLSDLPRNYTVNVFCPRCHGLFFPKSTRQANIDGAYFGTTFPHLYLMTHPVSISLSPNHLIFMFRGSNQNVFIISPQYRKWYQSNHHSSISHVSSGSKYTNPVSIFGITTRKNNWPRIKMIIEVVGRTEVGKAGGGDDRRGY